VGEGDCVYLLADIWGEWLYEETSRKTCEQCLKEACKNLDENNGIHRTDWFASMVKNGMGFNEH